MSVARWVFVLAVLGLPVSAQCTVSSVTFTPYGQGCNPVFGVGPPTLSGSFDPGLCVARLALDGFSGCCNTYLWNRLLAIGVAPASVAVPTVGQGCTLLVDPFLVLSFPGNQASFDFQLPPGASGTLFVQGANIYFTTIGFSYDAALSNGLRIDVN